LINLKNLENMKKITNKFLFASVSILALSFTSCSKDDATGQSTIEVVKGITGSVALKSGLLNEQTVNEPRNFRDTDLNEKLEYSFVVSIDKPQSVDIHVAVAQIAGSAEEGSDFVFDKDLVIPAYETSVEGTITILSDPTVEGDEDLKLQIGTASTSNATLAPTTVAFTIKNYLSPDLEFVFDYEQKLNLFGDFSAGYTLYTQFTTDLFNMDYYVYDASFNDTGLYEAQSLPRGSEKLIISDDSASASYLPDGTYYIIYYIYKNNFGTNLNFGSTEVPTKINYLRRGGIKSGTYEPSTFDYDNGLVPTTLSPEGDSNAILSFTKLNGVYTILSIDPIADPVASGKLANIKEKLKVAVANARRNHKN
jgi:hypothetical protein